MNSRLEQKLLQKALNVKFDETKEKLLDVGVEALASSENPAIKVKNICAYVPLEFADRLDNTLKFLKMSKREFITLAVEEALSKADKIILEVDIYQDEEEQREAA